MGRRLVKKMFKNDLKCAKKTLLVINKFSIAKIILEPGLVEMSVAEMELT